MASQQPISSGQPRHRLEIRVEHDDAFLAGCFGNERVQRPLGRREPAARLSIAVVHSDERDPGGPADAREERDIRLAAALDDRDRLAVDVVPERREHEREHQLLSQALDEHDRAGEEELAARSVELGHHPEVVVSGNGLGLEGMRPGTRTALDEDELVHPRHVEEGRRVRRVDDLIPGE